MSTPEGDVYSRQIPKTLRIIEQHGFNPKKPEPLEPDLSPEAIDGLLDLSSNGEAADTGAINRPETEEIFLDMPYDILMVPERRRLLPRKFTRRFNRLIRNERAAKIGKRLGELALSGDRFRRRSAEEAGTRVVNSLKLAANGLAKALDKVDHVPDRFREMDGQDWKALAKKAAIGATALTGAAAAVYFTKYGLPIPSGSGAREQAQNHLAVPGVSGLFDYTKQTLANMTPAKPQAIENVTRHLAHARETARSLRNVNLNDYSWNVAHKLRSGHEFELIRSAMAQYSLKHHVAVHLEHINGVEMIKVGNHIVNSQENREINRLIVS